MPSTLREKQRQMTRDLIIEAVSEIVVQKGVEFSMEEVADRAGVSLRTLYRYYPGRDELLGAIGDELTSVLGVENGEDEIPNTLEECRIAVRERFGTFGEHATLTRAVVALFSAMETAPNAENGVLSEVRRERARRNDKIHALIADDLEDLPDRTVDQIYAVARTLASSIGWSQMTGSAGQISSDEAGVAVSWALKTLMERARELQEQGIEDLEEEL